MKGSGRDLVKLLQFTYEIYYIRKWKQAQPGIKMNEKYFIQPNYH
jgi:hypothetical protein